ncbi:hypothetical protein C7I87_24175 [Mesorhizobium sp. SARCC-RB16n]|nr:hypothetical protein C7I87_24175 [Mesorhizobium sp. SARCC-RB16n]
MRADGYMLGVVAGAERALIECDGMAGAMQTARLSPVRTPAATLGAEMHLKNFAGDAVLLIG